MSWHTFQVWLILSACAAAATLFGCIVLTWMGWFGN